MNPEQQQIKIAEACGFYKEEPWLDGRPCWGHKDHFKHIGFEEIPDYLYDLNAMHEAEKTLTQDQMIDYSRHVGKSVTMYLPASRAAWMDFRLIHATAAQRAKAFLKTLNLWTEE
jgi:hypothetical protein